MGSDVAIVPDHLIAPEDPKRIIPVVATCCYDIQMVTWFGGCCRRDSSCCVVRVRWVSGQLVGRP